MCLVKVLQNNSNVHVNHNHKVDDDERHKEDNGDHRVATVAIGLVHVSDVAVRRSSHERVQDVIPASRSDQSGRRQRSLVIQLSLVVISTKGRGEQVILCIC